MTQQHPIMPPPELVDKWINQSPHIDPEGYIATCAAQWGADQQLDVCLRYAGDNGLSLSRMREALRPKPPSTKEKALYALDVIDGYAVDQLKSYIIHDNLKEHVETIRRTLELLPDDTTS
jgi:hypothetical protein